jgi:hypothetical protein
LELSRDGEVDFGLGAVVRDSVCCGEQ